MSVRRHAPAEKSVAPEEIRPDPLCLQGLRTVELDNVAGGSGYGLGGVFLGVAVGRDRRSGAVNLALQAQLQILAGLRVQMGRLAEGEDLPGVADAQDPQGLLVPAPGLRLGQVMRKIGALHQECLRVEEGFQAFGQRVPISLVAAAADGNGDHPGPGAIMDDKGQEGLDPVLLGKQRRFADQGVFEQLVHRRPVGGDLAQKRLEIPAGDRKWTLAAGKMVGT